jgi:hypothetical protein
MQFEDPGLIGNRRFSVLVSFAIALGAHNLLDYAEVMLFLLVATT